MNNEQIVNSIKLLCKDNNITITKLEEILGMSQGLISRWNKSDPSLSRIMDIAEYFHVSLDVVVGYKNIINDRFIEKLILQTSNKTLQWNNYNNKTDIPKKPERYEIYDNDLYAETSYYACINNGYIVIHGFYEHFNIKNPLEINLGIQVNDKASLVFEKYPNEQLKILWLKILYNLDEGIPDEIKAEEFKNSFISNDQQENINSIKNDNINSLLNNPSLKEFMETINTPEFQKLQQTFSNPKFQKTVQTFNNLQQNLNGK